MSSENSEKPGAAPTVGNRQDPVADHAPLRVRASGGAAPILPPRRPVIRPEVVRRTADYLAGGTENERSIGSYNEGKKLVVGRDIALSGSINACEKLIVEGRVEANIVDCQEIEIAETGTFVGEAEIDVAEISGVFEGTLIARELLLVRASGRVNGSVRYGRLEVERGGEIVGDVRVFKSDDEDDGRHK